MMIYVNGAFVESEKASISPYDHGYLYGLGVFETFRVYDGHPFLLHDHYERLTAALSYLNIAWTMTVEEMEAIVRELLERNTLQNAYIRFNVSAGMGEIGLQTEVYEQPTTLVFMKPLPRAGATGEKELVVLQQRRNTPEGAFRLKSHHYLNSILGKREIGDDMSKEGLFLTEAGYVAEGVVSNVFFVNNGCLHTPTTETGILAGITRQFVMTVAKQLGIEVKEGFFIEEELLAADEVFVTNSIQEIVPVHRIAAYTYPGKHGTVTQQLIEQYAHYRSVLFSKKELIEGGC